MTNLCLIFSLVVQMEMMMVEKIFPKKKLFAESA
jgi:hypothetical protein